MNMLKNIIVVNWHILIIFLEWQYIIITGRMLIMLLWKQDLEEDWMPLMQ